MFGLNFGGSVKSSNSNSVLDKTELTNQSSTQNTFGTTTNTQNTNQTNNSAGTSSTSQTGTQVADTKQTSDQVGKTSTLDAGTVAQLTSQLTALLSGGNATMTPTFDSNSYIEGVTKSAQATAASNMDATRGSLADMIGSKLDNSSMATLLAGRAATDSAAGVAGVTAQAQSTAAGIQNANAQTALAAKGQDASLESIILAALKGATSTTSQTGTTGTTGTTTNTSNAATNTAEKSTQDTASTAMQTVAQLVTALLSGSDVTHAVTNTKATELEAHGGFSI